MLNLYNNLAENFQELVDSFEEDMHANNVHFEQKEVYIACPDFVKNEIVNALNRMYLIGLNNSDTLRYRGVEFVPSYLMEVAIFYRHYPLYNKEYMIKKMSIDLKKQL